MTNHRPNVAPTDPRIIGFWKVVGGDYSLINEYRSDGTVIQHVGGRAGKPSSFRIEGDCIIYSLEQPDGSVSEDKTRYAISGDTLTFFYSPKEKMHFQRTRET